MPNKSIVIGALEGNYVAIKIFGYETPVAADAKDANWLCTEISVSAGVWSGRVRDAFVTTAEISGFCAGVERMLAGSLKEVVFEPMEPHLILKLSSEASGRVQISGVAFDEPEGVNAVAFNWLIDPKQLKTVVKQLKEIEEAYPVR